MKMFDDIQEAPPPKAGWVDGETTPPSIDPLVIDRAKIVAKSEIVRMAMQGEEADERLLFIDHPTTPAP